MKREELGQRQRFAKNRVGGGLTAPVLPHHRAYVSVHGGFFYDCNVTYLSKRLLRP
jgi:hypothetical protein